MANQPLKDKPEQFFEKEPRAAAFKSLFGVLNTTTYKNLGNESFGKGFPTYPEEIISEADTIKYAVGPEQIFPSRTRTWITASAESLDIDESEYNNLEPIEKLIRGHFSTSISEDTTSNPYVEKIICPLSKLAGSNDQFYFVFGKESQSKAEYGQYDNDNSEDNYGDTSKIIQSSYLQLSGSYILKNFINQFKFGSGYNALFFKSKFTDSDPNIVKNSSEIPNTINQKSNQSSGFLFDYKEGGLFIGTQPDNEYTDDPTLDPNLSSQIHPLWIEAYRYYGPTGLSGDISVSSLNVENHISASDIYVSKSLEVSGSLTIRGLSIESVTSTDSTGNSTFGSLQTNTHEFTGSVSITGSLFATASHAYTASYAQNAGQSGITTTIISNSLHDDIRGHYDITTLTSTDGNDVIEYKTTSTGLIISSSIGSPSFTHFIGFKSAATITKPIRVDSEINSTPIEQINPSGDQVYDMPSLGRNGGDIFRYTNSGQPNFASYGAFGYDTTHTYPYSTHSFSFPSPTKVTKLGLWYSKAQNTDPRTDSDNDYIDKVQLSGSIDGVNWTGLFEQTGMNNDRKGTPPNITSNQIDVLTDPRWSNDDNDLSPSNFYILNFTSSYFNSDEYKYYKLAVGGGETNLSSTNRRYHFIHHIDLWEDKNFGEGNRKQINIGFDDTTPPGETLTNFQSAVSSAASLAGFEGFPDPAQSIVQNGVATTNLSLGDNSITDVSSLSADTIFVNNLVTLGDVNSFTFNESVTTNQNILEQQDNIYMGINPDNFPSFPSESIVLKELNPIYFTDKLQDGNPGVDQFSSKIFGHYTDEGVSDLYLDAFRIFDVADKEIRLTTLHPEGLTHITSSQIYLDGNVTASGHISSSGIVYASNFYKNGVEFTGGGSGFPHNQLSTQITASITGSLIISGGEGHLPFIELGNIPAGTPESNLPTTKPTLYVLNNNLYFGPNLINASTNNWHIESSLYPFTHLTSSKPIFVDNDITASGNVDINNTLSIPGFNDVSESLAGISSSLFWYKKNPNTYGEKIATNFDVEILGSPSNAPASLEVQGTIKTNTLQADKLFLGFKNEPDNYYRTFLETIDERGVIIAGNPSYGDTDFRLTIANTAPNQTTYTSTLKFEHGGAGTTDYAADRHNAGKIVAGRESSYFNYNSATRDSNLQFYTAIDNVDVERMRILSNGKIGIGTSTPSEKLTVLGNISASGDLRIDEKAGIGGVDPQTTLHVANVGSKEHVFRIGGPSDNNSNNKPKIEFAEQSLSTGITYGFSIEGNADNTNNLYIKSHNNNATGITALSIKRDETKVGIGTEDPSKTLTVAGEISASSHLYASTSNANGNNYQTVLVDTSSGQFYYTGSYGGGGSTTVVNSGADNDWHINSALSEVTSSNSVLLRGGSGKHLSFNISMSTGNSSTLGAIDFSNELIFPNRTPFNLPPLAMMGAQATQPQSEGAGGTELFFRATKKDSTTSDLIMKINSDEGVTIDHKLKVTESIQIGDFGSGDKDSFLDIRVDGGQDTIEGVQGFNNFAGINLRHDNDAYGFTIQSQDGPSLDFPHGLNIISYAQDWTVPDPPENIIESRFFIDRIDGKIGIGTTTPGYKLEVNGDFYAENTIETNGNISAHGGMIEVNDISADNGASKIKIISNQDNTSGYTAFLNQTNTRFEISTNSRIRPITIGHLYEENGDTINRKDAIKVEFDGRIYFNHLGSVASGVGLPLVINANTHEISQTSSTRKVKKNISLAENSIYDDILKLKPSTFNYKNPKFPNPELGFIAEETSEVNPLFAIHGKNLAYDELGNLIKNPSGSNKLIDDSTVPVNINWGAITAALVGKIQSLEQRISDLENQ
jgi:hypothetical protein